MHFVLDLLPFPAIKLPKLKKLRQWSHDSLANLSQLTHRNSNNVDPKPKSRLSVVESPFPTNGISTISSAIREQRIDPKKDNFGLYALKCDRSSSLANARRGILLNLPTTVKAKEVNNFQSVERNHEVFQPCEKLIESTGIMYDGATSSASGNEIKTKIEPPPRRKKRPTATRTIVAQPKQVKKPALKQANQSVVKTESLEKNDSGLYRIVNVNPESVKLTTEEPRKKEHVVTMVQPKVQKAIAIKAKPVQQQVAKVKSYEWNKHQRKSSVGNIKPHFTKRYVASESSGGSFKSESSVDIFQSNRLSDQKKLFDEFDALFDKSRESCGRNQDLSEVSPESAFSKLNALKISSSSFLDESGTEDKTRTDRPKSITAAKPPGSNVRTQDFFSKSLARVEKPLEVFEEVSSKPKIVYEQPKVAPGIIKKKILYYDDKNEFQQLIMNQTQSTTIINNLYSAAAIPTTAKPSDNALTSEGRVPISCNSNSANDATGQFDLNGNDATEDYRRPSSTNNPAATSSNSLRIFSNEGIFVFNL